MNPDETLDAVRDAARWFQPGLDGIVPIVEAVGDARIVLIGEASYGTDEFYRFEGDANTVLSKSRNVALRMPFYIQDSNGERIEYSVEAMRGLPAYIADLKHQLGTATVSGPMRGFYG